LHVKSTSHAVVDLVIPVYNEAGVLERSVRRLAAAMADCGDFGWQIVVVNNGSTDDTRGVGGRLAEQLPYVTLLHLDAKGRGGALRKAWTQTRAEFSVFMDVDLSTDLAALSHAVRLLREGADVVTGSRLHPHSRITRCLKREILSRGYNALIRGVLGTRSFDDAQCGFKGVRVEAVRRLLPLVKNQDWFFDTELLVLAEYAGLTIRTLPIIWVEDPDTRVNIPMTIWQDLRGLVRLRLTGRRLVREWKG
jgi:glycosyltransferase involved in cell wall biosynthesis